MRLKRILSFLLIFALAVGMNVANVSAAELETEGTEVPEGIAETQDDVIYDTENVEIEGMSSALVKEPKISVEAQSGEIANIDENVSESEELVAFDEDNRIIFELPNPGDKKTFRIQIDHTLYPDARICIFPYGGFGDCTIGISEATAADVRTIRTKPNSGSTAYDMKTVFEMQGADGVKEHRVSVSTVEGNAVCAMVLATKETFADVYGDWRCAATVRKNQSTEFGVTFGSGWQRLLNGKGEWFRYTADGDTYIHASCSKMDDLRISVYDIDNTEEAIYWTDADDRETVQEGNGEWTGYVSKKVALEPGHDYYFQVQADSDKRDSPYKYLFSVGLPRTVYDMIEVRSSKTFSIPANTTKTFSFEVSGYPKSSRLGGYGRICFQTGSVVNNLDITSLQITAPNGRVLTAPSQGQYNLSTPIDYDNYLTSRNNIPLNGTWKVSIRSKTALSGLYFRIKAQVDHIPGKDGNE